MEPRRSALARRLSAALTLPLLLLGLAGAAPAMAADVGMRDFSYGTSVSAPTGQKPQSKLWYTSGGQWWGVLWSTTSKAWTIQKFDKATQKWSSTGVKVDDRRTAQPDAMWNGTTLYVVSALKDTSTQTDDRVLVARFSLSGSTWSPVGSAVSVTNAKPESVTMDRDSTGVLWMTFTKANSNGTRSVYVAHTTTSEATWGKPYVLPTASANNLDADDISTLVTYGNASGGRYVGVLWSNQADGTLNFARHKDGGGDGLLAWQRISLNSGFKIPDDHLNIKGLLDDGSGRVFAVVKTSLNDKKPAVATDPLIVVYAINGTSVTSSTVWRVGDDVTRAILLLDTFNKRVHVFGAGPCCSGGTVYYKDSSYDAMSFPSGLGTRFISLASDPKINNVTSTKQSVNATSGLLVEAGDDSTRYYVHNFLTLGAPPADTTPPDTTIVTGPPASTTSTSASFTFSSTEAGSTFECKLDAGAWTACASPQSYAGLAAGGHSFSVRATDAAGNTDPSPATQPWTITGGTPADTTPPETTLTSAPSGETTATDASLAFTSSEANSTFECRLDGGAWGACSSPKAYSGLAAGAHTFDVRATDAAGNTDQTPASAAWTVTSTTPPPDGALFREDFESGAFGSAWSVTTGGTGTAVVQQAVVAGGRNAARMTMTSATGSKAYARRAFTTPITDFTVTGSFDVLAEGASGGNVPLLRLLDSAGNRVVMLYRQNATSGQLYVAQNGTRVAIPKTAYTMPLGAWAKLELSVRIAGSASTVTLKVNGTQVYTTSAAALGTAGIKTLQLGNDTAAQAMDLAADDLSVTGS